MTEFGLRKFDPHSLKNDNIVLFTGKCGSGKSTVCEDLLYSIRDRIPLIIIISPTEKETSFYSRFIPHAFIYDNLDLDVLKQILQHNSEAKYSPVLIILDDCLYKKTAWNSDIIRTLIQNCRFYNIGVWIIDQLGMPAYIRHNVDIVFTFQDNSYANRENLYKKWFGLVDTFQEFDQLCNFYTSNHGILVLDKRNMSLDFSKQLFWYKAKWNTDLEKKTWRFGHLANKMYTFNDYLKVTRSNSDTRSNMQKFFEFCQIQKFLEGQSHEKEPTKSSSQNEDA